MPKRWKIYSEWFILSLSLALINHGGFMSGSPVFGTVLWQLWMATNNIYSGILYINH